MAFFDIFKTEFKINGLIGYFDLTDWWLSKFSEDERKYIIETYQPMGVDGESLIKEKIIETTASCFSFLSNLSTWFRKKEDKSIAYNILKKAEEYINQSSILDVHFFYHNKLEIYYKHRDYDKNALNIAIQSCEEQIKIAPKVAIAFKREYGNNKLPTHKGFVQLVIIKDKQKKYEEAIELCIIASQQRWSGDWEKRIERYNKKLNK